MRRIRFSRKSKGAITLISLALALLMVGGSLIWRNNYQPDYKPATADSTVFSLEQINQANGQNGNDCLVAVDGTVYKIVDSSLWQNGQHTTSQGQAYCGADLSEAMKKSPHGKAKLELLEKVGDLQ